MRRVWHLPVTMHPDEIPTSVALVRRLVSEQFPELSKLPVEPVASFGTDHTLYRLGSELVARMPRREVNEGSLKNERRWLPRLAPHLPLAVPTPVADGRPGFGYPFGWAVYRWLDGEAAEREPIADPAQAAGDLAEFISALQHIDPSGGPGPGPHNASRGSRSRAATKAPARPSTRCGTRSTSRRRLRCGRRRSPRPSGTAHPSGTTATWTFGICS